jgi:uncharacterized membrane-anchored protein
MLFAGEGKAVKTKIERALKAAGAAEEHARSLSLDQAASQIRQSCGLLEAASRAVEEAVAALPNRRRNVGFSVGET